MSTQGPKKKPPTTTQARRSPYASAKADAAAAKRRLTAKEPTQATGQTFQPAPQPTTQARASSPEIQEVPAPAVPTRRAGGASTSRPQASPLNAGLGNLTDQKRIAEETREAGYPKASPEELRKITDTKKPAPLDALLKAAGLGCLVPEADLPKANPQKRR